MTDDLREFYNSLYDELELLQYDRLYNRALNRLHTYTHGRSEDFVTEYDEEKATKFERKVYRAIKNTICELIHKMSLLEATEGNSGITSVSNKNYSESYKVYTEREIQDELNEILKMGLSGTGLAGAL